MSLKILVAIAQNGVIGKNNQLPWHFAEDLAYFKKLTTGNSIIMGHNTYKSLGKALPDRENLVISRQADLSLPDAKVYQDLMQAMRDYPDAFIIGGAQIFAAALPYIGYLYITHIAASFAGDSFFPDYSKADFEQISSQSVKSAASGVELNFAVYRRITVPQKPVVSHPRGAAS